MTEKGCFCWKATTSNPDVFKAHQPHENDALVCREADLDSADGWIELVTIAAEFPEHLEVINAAARSNKGLEKYGLTLRETLGKLNRKPLTFRVINRQRDSVELLRGFLNVFPDAPVHVCRNLSFGSPEKIRKATEEIPAEWAEAARENHAAYQEAKEKKRCRLGSAQGALLIICLCSIHLAFF